MVSLIGEGIIMSIIGGLNIVMMLNINELDIVYWCWILMRYIWLMMMILMSKHINSRDVIGE